MASITNPNDGTAKVYFERTPPYKDEMLMKAAKKEYKVEYELRVERPKRKIDEYKKAENFSLDEPIKNDKNPNVLPPEDLIDITKKIANLFPNFDQKSEKEKTLIAADIINGKYDSVIFGDSDKKSEE